MGLCKNARESLSHANYLKNQSQSFNYCCVVVAITVAVMVVLFKTVSISAMVGKHSQIMAFLLALLILHLQIHIIFLYNLIVWIFYKPKMCQVVNWQGSLLSSGNTETNKKLPVPYRSLQPSSKIKQLVFAKNKAIGIWK